MANQDPVTEEMLSAARAVIATRAFMATREGAARGIALVFVEREAKLRAELEEAKGETERMTVQLTGVSVAALGGTFEPATRDDWGWSAPYQDTLDLRRKYDKARADNGALRGRLGECRRLLRLARHDGELPDELMDDVDRYLAAMPATEPRREAANQMLCPAGQKECVSFYCDPVTGQPYPCDHAASSKLPLGHAFIPTGGAYCGYEHEGLVCTWDRADHDPAPASAQGTSVVSWKPDLDEEGAQETTGDEPTLSRLNARLRIEVGNRRDLAIRVDGIDEAIEALDKRLAALEPQDHPYQFQAPISLGCARCGGLTNAVHRPHNGGCPNSNWVDCKPSGPCTCAEPPQPAPVERHAKDGT